MKTLLNTSLLFIITVFIFSCSKEDASSQDNQPGGKTYSQMPDGSSKSFANADASSNNTFATITGNSTDNGNDGGNDDNNDDDGGDNDTIDNNPPQSNNNINYKSVAYTSITIGCGSGTGYYGITASNATPALTCTVYLASIPTASKSYSIEDIESASPTTDKAWLVVVDAGKTLIATSGTVYVSINANKVTVDFSYISVSDGSNSEQVSGSLSCQ